MVSARYLFEKRKERFVSVTTIISMLGIGVGVAALIVTMGIVNGFNNEIEEKILGVNPHVIIGRDGQIENPAAIISIVERIGGVVKTSEFLDGQALINSEDNVMGILIRGISPDPKKRLLDTREYVKAGTDDLSANGAIVGSELAKNLRLRVGNKFLIISPLSGKSREFKVNGIFSSGRYDYDLNLVFVNIEEARSLLGREGTATGIGIKVKDAFSVNAIRQEILSYIRPPYWVMTWKEIDKNLFSALRLEKYVLFIVVALIVFVACFNIVSTLVMTVMEKTKDIGILKAIGVTRFGIMSLFLLEGLYICVIGILLGSFLGLGLCYLQHEYKIIKLPPDVYYIYSVPIQVRMPDTAVILGAAFILGLIATLYPALHAARLNTVDILKYE